MGGLHKKRKGKNGEKKEKLKKRKKEKRRKGKYGGEEKIKDSGKGIKGGKLSEVCFL